MGGINLYAQFWIKKISFLEKLCLTRLLGRVRIGHVYGDFWIKKIEFFGTSHSGRERKIRKVVYAQRKRLSTNKAIF